MSKIEVIMWLVAGASLAGTILNIYHRKSCFLIWFFCNLAWTAYDIHKGAYPQAALMAIYAVLTVWGYYHWTRGKTKGKTKGKKYTPCNRKFRDPKGLRRGV